jgi:ZIP family zinc transporter
VAEVIIFAVIASSALVIGGVLGAYWDAPTTFTGIMLAFASGSLIAALCFELFPEAFELGGAWRAGIGLLLGGASFVAANAALDHWVAGSAQKDQREKVQKGSEGVGFALLAAVTLDGVPENLALGGIADRRGQPHAAGGDLLLEPAGIARGRRRHAPRRALRPLCDHDLGPVRGAPRPGRGARLGRARRGERAPARLLPRLRGRRGARLAGRHADAEAFEHGKPWNSFATAAGFFLAFMLATV